MVRTLHSGVRPDSEEDAVVPPRRVRPRSTAPRRSLLVAILAALVIGGGWGLWKTVIGRGAGEPVDLVYRIAVADPSTGRLDVRLLCDPVDAGRLTLGFSATSVAPTAPASKFRVREAIDGAGRTLSVEPGAGSWTVRGRGPLEIRYDVHLRSQRSRSAYAEEALSALDAGGGRLVGSDVFLFPVDEAIGSIDVRYELPEGWRLHHPFPAGVDRAAPPDLRALYTSVVAVGPYRSIRRQVGPCEIELAIRGHYSFGDDDLMRVITRVVEYQLDFFGQAPRDRYLFVVDPHPHDDDPELLHYFGLHFDASMLVLIDPRTDRLRLEDEPASLCAHEFFHNWLGEQLRQEGYEMNWFVEGITTLYAYRTRLATRMLDHGRYASQLRERFADHWQDASARASLTLADAGSIVLQDPAVTRMLYTGGLLVGVALDEEIARTTRGEAGLDDLVLRLVDRAHADPEYRLTREGLEAELLALTGRGFGRWLDRHVYGLDDLPLPGYVTGR